MATDSHHIHEHIIINTRMANVEAFSKRMGLVLISDQSKPLFVFFPVYIQPARINV
jgi:hypothetical protein